MKKILSVLILAAVSLAVLFILSGRNENTDYTHYFLNNTEFAAKETLLCSAPYEEHRGFDEEMLIDKGMLPRLSGFNNFSCTGMYYGDGSLYEIEFYWQCTADDNYRQLNLTLVPAEAEDLETRDGMVLPFETGNTETIVNGISVIGVGTVDKVSVGDRKLTNNVLIFEKDGMRYQIDATHQTTLAEMGAVLDFYLETDLDLSVFAMENGDIYDHVSRADYPEAFSECVPKPEGLPLEMVTNRLILKNGEPYSAELHYSYDLDNDGTGGMLMLSIDHCTPKKETGLGQLQDLTEKDIRTALEDNGEVLFLIGDYRVNVMLGREKPIEIFLNLLSTLPDYPEKKQRVDGDQYFRDNTALNGTPIIACRNGSEEHKERSLLSSWGELLENNVLPVIDGVPLEYINGYYYPEDKLCLISLEYGGVRAYIYPPDSERWDSYYDVDTEKCTETVVNGVTVYGDGLPGTPEQGVIFTLTDGSVAYIFNTWHTTTVNTDIIATLTEHLTAHRLDYDYFSMEKGDHYENVGLEDPRAAEFLDGYFVKWDEGQAVFVSIKNNVVERAVVHYETNPGKQITWTVYNEWPDTTEPWMSDIPFVTEEMVEEYLGEAQSSVMTCYKDRAIRIHVNNKTLADDVWELIQELA